MKIEEYLISKVIPQGEIDQMERKKLQSRRVAQ